ncbi:hypothetical protein PHYSODRAFT_482944 [Phytophthora sojae]|uniref:Retrotransposon gag domain-containing protein n=1 Tax=Phytophthora sojae (strain P6497) TaxID=1094619 RepID=G4YYF9_PHYSP|nr:hypothetical protein PHYSODRAFT_482944 [Phytophthora sojae]EGZ23902.1 hypothetical protein PHYSODRAFT_482944 [Phytophthora sojae]|eukprot:XP_009519190.1 hypothetical protein PHYSODRAFT_482944 [Phytophthora sojae]
MVSNLRGQAAAWFTTQQKTISNITELATALRKESIPAGLQERLRDKLYALKQRECTDLADYITKYRQLISHVTQMSELDQITLFVRCLVARTREEVQYRRCSTVSEAVSVAMEYERTHASFASSHARPRHQERQPMEIGNTRFLDRSECMRRNLYFRCKRPGHRMRGCRSGGSCSLRAPAARGQFGRQQGSRNERYSTSRDNAPRIHQSNFEETPRDPQIANTEDATEILFGHLTVRVAAVVPATVSGSSLMRKEGTVSLLSTHVTILLDSGADQRDSPWTGRGGGASQTRLY